MSLLLSILRGQRSKALQGSEDNKLSNLSGGLGNTKKVESSSDSSYIYKSTVEEQDENNQNFQNIENRNTRNKSNRMEESKSNLDLLEEKRMKIRTKKNNSNKSHKDKGKQDKKDEEDKEDKEDKPASNDPSQVDEVLLLLQEPTPVELILNESSPTTLTSPEMTKIHQKIVISVEEQKMNGAPVGDIYDSVVLEDTDLPPFDSETDALSALAKYCDTSISSSSWYEELESVVVIRRIAIHHKDILSDIQTLKNAVEIACKSVESLRSCNIKNGIMCLRAIMANYSSSITYECDISSKPISVLLNRTAVGPRFVCDMAKGLIFESAHNACIPPLLFIEALVPFAQHKNPDVACRAFELTAISAVLIDEESLTHRELSPLVTNMISLLFQGLVNSKRPRARDSAREAFGQLRALLSDIPFDSVLRKHLNSEEILKAYEILCQIEPSGAFEQLLIMSTPPPPPEDEEAPSASSDQDFKQTDDSISPPSINITDLCNIEISTSISYSHSPRNFSSSPSRRGGTSASRKGRSRTPPPRSSIKKHIKMMKDLQRTNSSGGVVGGPSEDPRPLNDVHVLHIAAPNPDPAGSSPASVIVE